MSFKEELKIMLEGTLSPLGAGESIDIDLEQRPVSISSRDKRIYSNALPTNKYYDTLADVSEDVLNALSQAEIVPHLNSEKWTGTFSGALSTDEDARVDIDLAKDGMPAKNSLLLMIHKMPSGNYELVSYIT